MTTKKPAKDDQEDSGIAAAKQLLKKALETGDEELIALANQLLDKPTKGKRGRPKKVALIKFTEAEKMAPGNRGDKGKASFMGNRFDPAKYADAFKDDTTGFDSKVKFRVSERREASEDIEVKCAKCSRSFFLPGSYAQYLSETRYYVCSKCGGAQ